MNNLSVADTSALHLDVNKYRLDEINKIKSILRIKLKKEKI